MRCDECAELFLLDQNGARIPRQARYRRSHGGAVLLLCYGHANAQRELDGMKALKGWV